ncbi:hypothetical protein P175DRAFT_0511511 [Aspergillus ochraceoroseus IBT 24754]|uniref:Major facilitator superfamily (MFS) profile domain-containing protein n=2 Tax=Aspergillus ochraceoroseus TaxID=138278 RepID=A0A2T5LP41_9EURO|nr:uncharacterized protein P175DRAFT_0511511 [Aspergillus ochraceoroseus IBT 24754]PTU18052.1 hypothetical protein P175DRAFT_0511511 [Aspergillus ochraceoroseus IBT 24754]
MARTKADKSISEALLAVLPSDRRPWYKVPHLIRLNAILVGILLFSSTVGYDISLMNGLQSMGQWTEFMNHPAGAWLGFIGAIQSLGGVIGMPLQASFSNRYGRKPSLWVGYIFLAGGVAMQTATPIPALFIVSRFIVGFSSAWFMSAPVLIAELAYPTQRSKVVALYQPMYYVGSVLSSWATFGCRNMASSWGWRIPVVLQITFPVISIPFVLLCPESPRWLVRNGKSDQARQILTKYHAGGDEQSPLVNFQMEEIADAIRVENELAYTASWMDMLRTKGNRRRLYISATLGVSAQWNGVGIVSYYLSLILNSVGITSVTQQTMVNGFLQIWNLILAIVGAQFVDFAGRRMLFIISTVTMLISYILITGLAGSFATTQVSAVGTAVIPFLFIFYGGYDLAWTPLLVSYPAEIWSYSLRAKGVSLAYMFTYLALLFNQLVNPIALDAIGWKYYILYIALLVIILVNVWFTYPETRGYSLEEMAVLFDQDDLGEDERGSKMKREASHTEHVETSEKSGI